MVRLSYGVAVKARVKRVFEALLAYVDAECDEGDNLKMQVSHHSDNELIVTTNLQSLEKLTAKDKYDGTLNIGHIRDALMYLKDFLEILKDRREAKRGSKTWHFSLKLWHKDKAANLRQFDIEWDNRRSPKSKQIAALATFPSWTPYENLGRRGVKREQFTGRDQDLETLHKLLQQNSQLAITAISGMGGVGKTELAIQYARQCLTTYPGGVFFSPASDFPLKLVEFARPRFFPNINFEEFSSSEQVAYCWQHWAEGDVLLVLDDVSDYKQQLQPYLPESPRFKVLITTRERLGKPIVLLDLDVLAPADALELLKSLLSNERVEQELDIAVELCEWLGYLPLGLELVGRYLEEEPLSLAQILQRLKEERLENEALNEADRLMNDRVGVREAFNVSWKGLNENAQQLVCLLSLFALAAIPWKLVEEVYQCLRDEPFQPKKLEKPRRDLIKLHLLKNNKEQYSLHQLIREFFKEKLENLEQRDEMKRAFATAMVALAKTIPHQPTLEDITKLTPVIPHIEEVANQDNHLIGYLSPDDLICPFIGLGWFYEGQGFYQQAEPWLQQCVEVAKKRLGAEHPDVATSLNNLAGLYYSQGRYKEAETLYLQALEIGNKSLPPDHPQIAKHVSNLAQIYYYQGRYDGAGKLYLQALEIYKKSLPPDHPGIAIYLNNLACIYYSQGRYKEAEQLYWQAFEINKKSLLGDHLSIAPCLNNLAGMYRDQGRYDEAEPLYLQALEIDKKSLPADHPSIATCLHNLAGLYRDQRRYNEAEQLYLQALEIDKKSLPPGHSSIATCLNNLAGLYRDQGRYNEAEQLYLQALEINKKSLPPDHPSIAIDLNNLAGLYYSQGRYDEAQPLYVQSLTICDRSLGAAHPHTTNARQNFANFLRQAIPESGANLELLRDNPVACEILEEVLAEVERSQNATDD